VPYLCIADKPLFYAVHPSEESEPLPVVLIHGAGGSHLSWPFALRRLSVKVTTYLPDLPSHGRSVGQGSYAVDEFADIVLELCHHLTLKGAVLVGHSMGGAVALAAALRKPQVCRSLVLLNSAAKFSIPRAIFDALEQSHERAVALICEYAFAPEYPAPLVEITRRMLLELPLDTLRNDFLTCHAFDVTGKLATIHVPTLIIGSSEDMLTPLALQCLMAERIPHSKLVVLQRAGHMAPLTRTEEIRTEILNFLGLTKN